MRRIFGIAAVTLPLLVSHQINAANFDDPSWPCIQRKVPNLSIGQMWSGPIVENSAEGSVNGDTITTLAAALAVRRTSLEEAEVLIDDFAKAAGDDRNDRLARLFALVFEKINDERAQIIGGIARYAGKQSALAERINSKQEQLAALEAKEDKSNDEFDELELLTDTIAWDNRIFEERQQSLTYVCETPVLLEKRAFSLSRIIMDRLQE